MESAAGKKKRAVDSSNYEAKNGIDARGGTVKNRISKR
jgi:hypothetical protein